MLRADHVLAPAPWFRAREKSWVQVAVPGDIPSLDVDKGIANKDPHKIDLKASEIDERKILYYKALAAIRPA